MYACRRYADSWDSAKVAEDRRRRAEAAGEAASLEAQQQKQQQAEGPGLAEDFGAHVCVGGGMRGEAQAADSHTCHSPYASRLGMHLASPRMALPLPSHGPPFTWPTLPPRLLPAPPPAVAAAKGGSAALKPFLAGLYRSRAQAYRDAAQQFVEGYKHGFQQAMKPEVPEALAAEAAEAAAAAARDETAATVGAVEWDAAGESGGAEPALSNVRGAAAAEPAGDGSSSPNSRSSSSGEVPSGSTALRADRQRRQRSGKRKQPTPLGGASAAAETLR